MFPTTTASSHSSLSSSFPRFSSPRCPPEIRDLIWTFAIAGSPRRTIQLRLTAQDSTTRHPQSAIADTNKWLLQARLPYKRYISVSGGRVEYTTSYSYTSPCSIPSLLHTCARSRQLSMRRWTLGCGVKKGQVIWDGIGDGMEKVWFDPEEDTLLFLGSTSATKFATFLQVAADGGRSKIRHVAFDLAERHARSRVSFGNITDSGYEFGVNMHELFPVLKTMSLLVGVELDQVIRGEVVLSRLEYLMGRSELIKVWQFEDTYDEVLWEKPEVAWVIIERVQERKAA